MFGLLRMPRFIRRFIRRRTAHLPESRALEIKEKLSMLYALVAWNMFGGIAYMMYTGRWKRSEDEENLSSGRWFAHKFNWENATIHRVKGLTYIDQVDINEENLESAVSEDTTLTS